METMTRSAIISEVAGLDKALKTALSFASVEDNRLALQGVHIQVTKTHIRLEATNGHVAIRMEARNSLPEGSDPESYGEYEAILSPETVKVAINLLKNKLFKNQNPAIELNGKFDVKLVGAAEIEVIDCAFPNLDQIIPKVRQSERGTGYFGVAPCYLALLGQAGNGAISMKCQPGEDACNVIRFDWTTDAGNAGWTCTAVVMPIRL